MLGGRRPVNMQIVAGVQRSVTLRSATAVQSGKLGSEPTEFQCTEIAVSSDGGKANFTFTVLIS